MDLSTEKQRPQKVEVVNNSAEPLKAQIENFPNYATDNSGNLRISLGSIRPLQGQYLIQTQYIYGLKSDGTYLVLPYYSLNNYLSTAQLTSFLASIKNAHSTIASGVVSLTLHYLQTSVNGATTSEVYNLKD